MLITMISPHFRASGSIRNFHVNASGKDIDVSAKMSSVSTDKKNWPDRTQVTRRMKQVSLDELLDNIDL